MQTRNRKGKGNLTLEERRKIEEYTRIGFKPTDIAETLGRNRSTIYKELKRGKCEKYINYDQTESKMVYDWYYSHEQSKNRVGRQGRTRLLKPENFQIKTLVSYMRDGNSPYAAIQKALRSKELTNSICVSTLYSYIATGQYGICHDDLLRPGVLATRRKNAERDEAKKTRDAKGRPKELSIDKRPKHIAQRKQFGHWEGDLVLSPTSKSREAIFTLIERKTRFYIGIKIPSKHKKNVLKALDELEQYYGCYFSDIFKTITFDNGGEFLDYEQLQRSVLTNRGSPRFNIYYAHPFRSGERGSNETTNGFLRRYFPKGTSFAEISDEELQEKIAFINSYPRMIHQGNDAYSLYLKEARKVIARHDALNIATPSTVVA